MVKSYCYRQGLKFYRYRAHSKDIGVTAPTTTLTPQGPADTGYAGDFWQFNTQGELVRVHRQHRKTLFTPSRTQCPVPAEQPSDSRMVERTRLMTSIKAFRIKKGTALPETLQQQIATKTQPRSAPQKVNIFLSASQFVHVSDNDLVHAAAVLHSVAAFVFFAYAAGTWSSRTSPDTM